LKLLLDTCLSAKAKAELKAAGHDVVWSGDWPEDPGDEAILWHAYKDGRILVTLDKDFGELIVHHGSPHCGVLRLVNFRAGQQGAVCAHVLEKHADELTAGAIITAEPGILRIRQRHPVSS
jgi:predicted nuclease of predicted toxin-antitoxin system